MSVQAAAASKPITSPKDFEQFLEFGKHRVPIDTATSWAVYPSVEPGVEPKRQIFQVSLWLDTLRDGKPVDYVECQFHADTLAKASGLIQRLRECNVRWHSWLVRVEPSFERRAIRLQFEDGIAGALVKNDQSILDLRARDIFKIFGRIAGAPLQGCQIVDVEAGSVDLTFQEEASEEALVGKMNQALEGMQRLFLESEPFRELAANIDPRFKVREDLLAVELAPVEEEAEGDFAEEPKPAAGMDMDPMMPPYFSITEDAVSPQNRFVGKGRCPWSAEDLPFLIANNRGAPGKKDRDEDDGKQAFAGDRVGSVSSNANSAPPADAAPAPAPVPAPPGPAPIQLRQEKVAVVTSKCCC